MADITGNPDFYCPAWGPLDRGQLEHLDCPVVLQPGHGLLHMGKPEGNTLRVCACECSTCKRAWWAAERPKVIDGKVVSGEARREAERGGTRADGAKARREEFEVVRAMIMRMNPGNTILTSAPKTCSCDWGGVQVAPRLAIYAPTAYTPSAHPCA